MSWLCYDLRWNYRLHLWWKITNTFWSSWYFVFKLPLILESLVFVVLLPIFELTPAPIHAQSRTCWCTNINGRMTKAGSVTSNSACELVSCRMTECSKYQFIARTQLEYAPLCDQCFTTSNCWTLVNYPDKDQIDFSGGWENLPCSRTNFITPESAELAISC